MSSGRFLGFALIDVKTWDVRAILRPSYVDADEDIMFLWIFKFYVFVFLQVHEYLRSKLCSLYENDCIFDKFECCWNGSDR